MPRAWLFAIARNMLARHYRRQRDPQRSAELWYEPVSDARAIGLAMMREAIKGLPGRLRYHAGVRLRTGIVLEEIAQVLEIPVGTVRSRLHTAVRHSSQHNANQKETT